MALTDEVESVNPVVKGLCIAPVDGYCWVSAFIKASAVWDGLRAYVNGKELQVVESVEEVATGNEVYHHAHTAVHLEST